jgi:hypothetical protein
MGRGKRDQRGPKGAQEEGQEERRSHEQEGGGGVGEGRGGSEEKGKNHMRHEAAQEWDPKNARALSKGESSHIIMESIESITSELLRPRASRGLACYCKVGSHLRAPPAKLHQDPPFPDTRNLPANRLANRALSTEDMRQSRLPGHTAQRTCYIRATILSYSALRPSPGSSLSYGR